MKFSSQNMNQGEILQVVCKLFINDSLYHAISTSRLHEERFTSLYNKYFLSPFDQDFILETLGRCVFAICELHYVYMH